MTVPYQKDVPTTFSSTGWWRAVVCRWRGGVYKLVIFELIGFLCLYYLMWGCLTSFRFTWNVQDGLVKQYREYQGTIRFMLGFMLVYYYQEIYARARRIFFAIPFPDSCFIAINSIVGDGTPRGQLLKQTIFRYILATTFQSYYASSSLFRKAFLCRPWESMKELGLLTNEETRRLRRRIDGDYPYPGEVSFVPIAWATMTLRKAFEEGHVQPDYRPEATAAAGPTSSRTRSNGQYPTPVQIGFNALHDYRRNYGSMLFEVYFAFPLLLSQLVTLTVYFYFAASLVAQQNLSDEWHSYFPIFTMAEFIVYMGALRVGQTYTNPLGRDENSFEMVAFFNRNLRLAHLYGGYGGAEKYDMVLNPLPVVDMTELQRRVMPTIPLKFYSMVEARVPPSAVGGVGAGEVDEGMFMSSGYTRVAGSKVMANERLIPHSPPI
jgi:hypothetical protein